MTKQLQKKLGYTTLIKLLTVLLWYCSTTELLAQVQNNGTLHVADNGRVFINTGDFNFGSASTTATSKTNTYASTDGKIMLGSGVVFDTDGTASKFVNGYAGTFNTGETTLALGANLVYAPIKVTATTNDVLTNKNVHATYFNSNPLSTYTVDLDVSVNVVADTEYWIVKGENAVLSLSWRESSNLDAFTASLPGVTIVGYNTVDAEWQVIDSTPESGATLTSGFIKSTNPINLSEYSAFAIGEKGVDCFPAVTASSTKDWFGGTWDGTGWNGTTSPLIENPVTLHANYNGPGFKCYSLNLQNYNVTLTSGTLEVVGNITGSGKIILDENDGLVQHISIATKPQIELTRTTRSGMRKFDYVYWGSPVTENVLTQLDANAIAVGETTPNAFDLKYKYVSGDTSSAGGWKFLDATVPGKGFIMRIAEQAPFTGTGTGSIDLKFTGTANNGDVQVAVDKVAGNDTSARNNNLLANPYPSAIDAEKFLIENNSLVDGVIYLWRANTPNSTGTTQYAVADYIAYTKAGVQSYSGTTTTGFDGHIASGQGFKVRALTNGTAKFTNCMRVIDNNSQFLRTNAFATSSSEVALDRFRISLQTDNGIANQILVAYLPETTLAYDYMYDARMLTTAGTNIYSILDNDTQKLAINARPDFTNTDEVILGFSKEASVTNPMLINIVDHEGIFANNQTPIYLHDTQLNVYHNFANGGYSFTTTAQEDNNRFKIVYQAGQLNNDAFDTNAAFATLNNQVLAVNASLPIKNIMVYDITGRLILDKTVNSTTSFNVPFHQPQAVYIVKIGLDNGQIVTTKLINQN